MALLAWPLLLVLRRAPGGVFAAAVLLIGAVIAPAMLGQSSTVLALAAGGAVFGLGARFGPAALRLVGGALAILLLAMPWLILAADRSGGLAALAPLTPASTEARLEIWALVSAQVVENPLRGWGLDASRLLPPPVSLHPHNGPLQIWYELGAHGAILAALIWWALLDLAARAAKHDRLGGAAAAAAATAYFVIGALSFGVWQEWWLGLGAVTAAVSAAVLVWRRWDRMAHPSGTEQLRPLELQRL
jgi:O-antigen ligase